MQPTEQMFLGYTYLESTYDGISSNTYIASLITLLSTNDQMPCSECSFEFLLTQKQHSTLNVPGQPLRDRITFASIKRLNGNSVRHVTIHRRRQPRSCARAGVNKVTSKNYLPGG